jgi:lysophospholipase L1-like esterase
MTLTIVCFGDSNTHGADPTGAGRMPREVRWPGVMRAALGDGYEVIEEGLNGRATVWESPIAPGRNGLTAPEISNGAGVVVDAARSSLSGPDGTPPRVLLVAPVPLGAVTARSEQWGMGAAKGESERLAAMYQLAAEARDVGFFDAGSVAQVSADDGVHLDRAACASLGAAMADAVRAELERGAAQ